ncbi:hypothetical protein L3Y34_015422 [Caenorhabditis briggsae]|uniref:ShKT domain-containing protein n=1 Tax=Caenorhabditis briggsae TaxID=6238 RepID=A0AAE9IZN8_CAEBR|nr:hypothetical protein L3Y34_015422 [Caenorhabditis briggsae]
MTTIRTRNGLWLLVVFTVSVAFGNAEILEGAPPKFQVLRAHASDVPQLNALRDIQHKTENELDFWQTPSKVGHRADIMVDADRMEWLDAVLKSSNISYDVIIDDVQKLILEKEHGPSRYSKLLFSKRMHNEGGNRARYGFGEYHSYQTICDWMIDIEKKYPDKAKVFTMGTTVEGRPIQGIKIGNQVWRNDKRIFWIDGGIHAREWAAVHTTLWFIDRLIADYNDDALVRTAVDRLNFYILPVANPDGYEYSRSDVSPMVRLWRKNRAGVVCKKDRWFRDRCCGGVDLNRNYDWHFGETGSSTDKCSEIYQGSSAFSEIETRSMRDFLTSPELNGKIDAFITLHTYSQMWIHPYSHARKSVPADVAELERVGKAAVAALENTYGTQYKFGTGSDILYPSAGGSDDWAKGTLRIKYVYLLELRPGEDVWDGFILDQHQLIPTAKETWNGVKVVIRAVSDQAASLPDSIASTLPPITLPPPPPTTTTTTTAAPTTTTTQWTTTPWTTTPWTSTPWTTTPWTTTAPFSSIFIVTEPAPVTRTTPTHLDAFYKLGKRRFKFVSIKTFLPTLPTTPMPVQTPALPPTFTPPTPSFPAFSHHSAFLFSSSFSQTTSLPFVTVVGPNENNEVIDDFEGASPRVLPAFVRRPNGSVVRTNTRRPGSRQFMRRPGGFAQQRIVQFRNRSPNRGQTSNTNQRPPQQQQQRPRGNCVDRSAWCASWLSANSQVCQISAIYMRQDCARTCRFC